MTENDGSGNDLLYWAKILLMIIGAIVVLGFVLNIVAGLFPFLVVAGVLYVLYRVFIKSDDKPAKVEPSEPMLLEHEDPLFEDDDELEAKFRELEAKQRR